MRIVLKTRTGVYVIVSKLTRDIYVTSSYTKSEGLKKIRIPVYMLIYILELR